MSLVRLGAFAPLTEAMGPGKRACVWVQGCTIDCPGCATPELIPNVGGETVTTRELADRIREARDSHGIEGVSFSGGEPFEQAMALAEITAILRAEGLSILAWSGHPRSFLEGPHAPPGSASLLASLDVLIDGRFVLKRVARRLPLRGSTNQRIHLLTDRYRAEDFASAGFEARFTPEGNLVMDGVADAQALRQTLRLLGIIE